MQIRFTETFGTQYGMGYYIMDAWLRVNYLEMYAGILVLSAMGLLLFGLVSGFLAIFHGGILFASPYLLAVGLLVIGGWVAVSRAYFFLIPFVACSLCLVLYVASIVAARV